MSAESNKELVRFLIEEALNKGRIELADEHVASDYFAHIPGLPPSAPGRDGFKRVIERLRGAFEDWHMTIEELVAEGTSSRTGSGRLDRTPAR